MYPDIIFKFDAGLPFGRVEMDLEPLLIMLLLLLISVDLLIVLLELLNESFDGAIVKFDKDVKSPLFLFVFKLVVPKAAPLELEIFKDDVEERADPADVDRKGVDLVEVNLLFL